MSAAAMMFGGERPTPRPTLAFSLSVLLHLAFALLIYAVARREAAFPPLEISIFDGPKGPASPPPGEKSATAGPVGALAPEAKPVEAPPDRKSTRLNSSH